MIMILRFHCFADKAFATVLLRNISFAKFIKVLLLQSNRDWKERKHQAKDKITIIHYFKERQDCMCIFLFMLFIDWYKCVLSKIFIKLPLLCSQFFVISFDVMFCFKFAQKIPKITDLAIRLLYQPSLQSVSLYC